MEVNVVKIENITFENYLKINNWCKESDALITKFMKNSDTKVVVIIVDKELVETLD